MVRLVEEDGERDDEEHQDCVDDVHRVPELLHRQSEVARSVHHLAAARVAVGDVQWEHQDGQLGHGEPKHLRRGGREQALRSG